MQTPTKETVELPTSNNSPGFVPRIPTQFDSHHEQELVDELLVAELRHRSDLQAMEQKQADRIRDENISANLQEEAAETERDDSEAAAQVGFYEIIHQEELEHLEAIKKTEESEQEAHRQSRLLRNEYLEAKKELADEQDKSRIHRDSFHQEYREIEARHQRIVQQGLENSQAIVDQTETVERNASIFFTTRHQIPGVIADEQQAMLYGNLWAQRRDEKEAEGSGIWTQINIVRDRLRDSGELLAKYEEDARVSLVVMEAAEKKLETLRSHRSRASTTMQGPSGSAAIARMKAEKPPVLTEHENCSAIATDPQAVKDSRTAGGAGS